MRFDNPSSRRIGTQDKSDEICQNPNENLSQSSFLAKPVRVTREAPSFPIPLARARKLRGGITLNLLYASGSDAGIFRKEVIQPQVLLRLPCYDFTPIMSHTLGACLPCGLARRLLVQPTFVM